MSSFPLRSAQTTLPQTGVVVTLRQPTFAEVIALSSMEALGAQERITALLTLAAKVATWNATDPSGAALPVTIETLGDLPAGDANALIEQIVGLINLASADPAGK